MSATTVSRELSKVEDAFSWGEIERRKLQHNAIDAAWCDDATKAWLYGML
jgi:adenosine deaminase